MNENNKQKGQYGLMNGSSQKANKIKAIKEQYKS